MTTDQTKRLSYIVRARVAAADIAANAVVDAFAEVIADELLVYLKLTIPGRRVTVDAPENRFHALLYALGLPYRKRTLEVSADGTY